MNGIDERVEFSDEELDAILEQVSEWGRTFERTHLFEGLTSRQRAEAGPIVMTIAELLYAYEGRRPEEWDRESLERVTTEVYPASVAGGVEHFEDVAPVLAAFLTFLGDRGDIDRGDALAAAVEEFGETIVSRAEDPEHWGMGKSMIHDAVDAAGRSLDEVETTADLDAILEAAGVQELDLPETTSTAPPDPSVLERDRALRFEELFDSLLAYANDRNDVLEGIETVADLTTASPEEVYQIRNRMIADGLEDMIDAYVAATPHGLAEADYQQIARWRHAIHGSFVVMEYRPEHVIFLEPDEPRAYAVKNVAYPLARHWPESALPLAVSEVLLLPFDGVIVADGLIEHDPIAEMMWDEGDLDIEQRYGEAKHRFGVAERLPPPEDTQATPVEELRYYLKNEANRERYAEQIDELKGQSAELDRVYHEELGKAAARGLGRRFRELDLRAAYVAIYDGQVVATAASEQALSETLEAIMPPRKADDPYVYHYDP